MELIIRNHICENNIESLKEILETNDIEYILNPKIDEHTFIPLIYATNINNYEMVQLLLRHKANVNITDHLSENVLYKSIKNNNMYITRLLLDHKINMYQLNKFGDNILKLIVYLGYNSILKLILDYGYDINTKDDRGCTILMSILFNPAYNHIWFDTSSHSQDLKITSYNTQNYTNLSTIKMLLKYNINTSHVISYANNMFDLCVKIKSLTLISFIFDNLIDVNVTDYNNQNILLYYLKNNYTISIKFLKYLISKSINLDQIDKFNNNAIMLSIKNNKPLISKLLISQDINLNYVDKDGNNALINSIFIKNIDLIKTLLQKNIDINHTNNNIDTALMTASRLEEILIVKILLEHDANISIENKNNHTALDIAIFVNNTDLINMLSNTSNLLNYKDENTECPICISEYKKSQLKGVLFKCGHIFHYNCINKSLKVSNKCPICRSDILYVDKIK